MLDSIDSITQKPLSPSEAAISNKTGRYEPVKESAKVKQIVKKALERLDKELGHHE